MTKDDGSFRIHREEPPRLVDDGVPEEKQKKAHQTTWPEAAIWIVFFFLIGWIFWVIFK